MQLPHHLSWSCSSCVRGDHRAADDVAVAVQVLGGRMHDHVGAERERLLPDRRQERVVGHHQRARGLGPRCATSAMSTMRSSGLLGVSIQTSAAGFAPAAATKRPASRSPRTAPASSPRAATR